MFLLLCIVWIRCEVPARCHNKYLQMWFLKRFFVALIILCACAPLWHPDIVQRTSESHFWIKKFAWDIFYYLLTLHHSRLYVYCIVVSLSVARNHHDRTRLRRYKENRRTIKFDTSTQLCTSVGKKCARNFCLFFPSATPEKELSPAWCNGNLQGWMLHRYASSVDCVCFHINLIWYIFRIRPYPWTGFYGGCVRECFFFRCAVNFSASGRLSLD